MRWKGLGGTVHNPRKTVLSHFSSNDFNEHTVFLQVNTQVHFTFPSKLRSKQTCNYITQTMQKEPDSTGGFKKTTKWASDTHRSLPLSLSLPSSWIYNKKKEWTSISKEGKSRAFYQSASTWPMKMRNTCCVRAAPLVVPVLLRHLPDGATAGQHTKHLHHLHDHTAALTTYLGRGHSATESSFLGKF